MLAGLPNDWRQILEEGEELLVAIMIHRVESLAPPS